MFTGFSAFSESLHQGLWGLRGDRWGLALQFGLRAIPTFLAAGAHGPCELSGTLRCAPLMAAILVVLLMTAQIVGGQRCVPSGCHGSGR
jgi:hypothetical protein